ncbi:MAG: hypothetical protein MZV63_66410 [Marinilabiliales bacterium]|nr:hypothetical protein [Marinilabiliales bacterium]
MIGDLAQAYDNWSRDGWGLNSNFRELYDLFRLNHEAAGRGRPVNHLDWFDPWYWTGFPAKTVVVGMHLLRLGYRPRPLRPVDPRVLRGGSARPLPPEWRLSEGLRRPAAIRPLWINAYPDYAFSGQAWRAQGQQVGSFAARIAQTDTRTDGCLLARPRDRGPRRRRGRLHDVAIRLHRPPTHDRGRARPRPSERRAGRFGERPEPRRGGMPRRQPAPPGGTGRRSRRRERPARVRRGRRHGGSDVELVRSGRSEPGIQHRRRGRGRLHPDTRPPVRRLVCLLSARSAAAGAPGRPAGRDGPGGGLHRLL